jgi:type IV pilus assembly protein PilQ
MGDVEGMSRPSAGRTGTAGGQRGQRWVTTSVLILALAGGCTSSQPARVVDAGAATERAPASAPAGAPAAPAADGASAKSAAGAVEIRNLELREGAPDVFVDLEASAPLVWTSFRNPEGKVVIELPNAVPSARVQDVNPDDGLISSVKVQRETEGSRPMTRLVIATRHEVEHSVTADGLHLQIRLLPIDAQARAGAAPTAPAAADAAARQKLAFEPVPASPPPAPAAESAQLAPASPPPAVSAAREAPAPPAPPAASGRAGTPDEPAVAPAPSGAPATRLESVEVLGADASGGGVVVRIAGDGEFPYSTFALSDPSRFVLDLQGVVNRTSHSTIVVQNGVVQRVRVAQFKPGPKGVARVVFDLRQGAVPRIERTPQALVVSFQTEGMAAAASSPPAVSAASAPPPPAPPAADSTAAAAAAPPAAGAQSQGTARRSRRGTKSAAASTPPSAPPAAPAASQDAAAAPAAQPSDLSLRPSTASPGGGVPVQTAGLRRNDIQIEDAPPPPAGGKTKGSGLPRVAQTANALQQPSAELGRKQSAGEKLGTDINPDQKQYTGEPIDLKVTNADVTEVLRTFAQISGLNIVVQPGVTGTVTAELENVPWDQAFEEVLKINSLGYEREGNVLRIAPTSVLQKEAQERQLLAQARALVIPLRTVMRRLSYANAENIAALLKSGTAGLLTQRGSVIVDDRTNTLIIKELPEFLDAVLAVISNLDTPEPQVMIEARIIETTKTFSRSLGINWGFNGVADPAHGNTTGLVFPNQGSINGQVTLDQPANGTLGISLGNVLNTFKLDLMLEAAESEGLVNILSAPKVATLNNQQAYIQSGVQLPVQTITNNTVTVQYINATLRLEVTPQVTAEGTVVMDINISKKEPDTGLLIANAASAPISTKDAKTRLVVRDGATAVIGGIYKVTTDANEGRVPGLASLPIVGYLFRNKERDQTNDELLIFITPRVIKI